MYYNVKRTAEIIKQLRSNRELTQEVASNDMGINIKTYQAVEQGIRGMSIDTLCIIADYFKVSLDYLINETNKNGVWDILISNIDEQQQLQLFNIVENMISTLGWNNSHNVG